jgi:hypothetical protein
MPSVFRRSNKTNSEDQTAAQFGLVPEDDIISARRPHGSRNLRLSFEGRVSTPVGLFSQILPEHEPTTAEGQDLLLSATVLGGGGAVDEMEVVEETPVNLLARAERAVKRQRQWRKWSEDVIPALLQPYMALLRETEGLRDINSKREANSCTGCSAGRLLDVTCVYFESKLM